MIWTVIAELLLRDGFRSPFRRQIGLIELLLLWQQFLRIEGRMFIIIGKIGSALLTNTFLCVPCNINVTNKDKLKGLIGKGYTPLIARHSNLVLSYRGHQKIFLEWLFHY